MWQFPLGVFCRSTVLRIYMDVWEKFSGIPEAVLAGSSTSVEEYGFRSPPLL